MARTTYIGWYDLRFDRSEHRRIPLSIAKHISQILFYLEKNDDTMEKSSNKAGLTRSWFARDNDRLAMFRWAHITIGFITWKTESSNHNLSLKFLRRWLCYNEGPASLVQRAAMSANSLVPIANTCGGITPNDLPLNLFIVSGAYWPTSSL